MQAPYLRAACQVAVKSRLGRAAGVVMLYLRTFGGCYLERDGALVDGLSAQRKALAFLALLAGAGSRGVPRDVAATLLWPDSDDDRARASLKQLVHALRTRIGVPDIVLGNGDLRLNPDRATSD